MKTRRVVVVLEMDSDEPCAELRRFGRWEDAVIPSELRQVQVNVIQEKKALKRSR